eukprot:sb/3478980/
MKGLRDRENSENKIKKRVGDLGSGNNKQQHKVRFLIMRTACAQIRAFHAHHTSRATNFNSKLEFARLRFAFLKIRLYVGDERRRSRSLSGIYATGR